MRPIILASTAFLAGGILVYSVVEGASISLDDVTRILEPAEAPVAQPLQLAQAEESGDNSAVAADPDNNATPPAEARNNNEASDNATQASEPAEDYSADRPVDEAPPLGISDPEAAQAGLPDDEKMDFETAPAEAPEIGRVGWSPDALYCGFAEAEVPETLQLASLGQGGMLAAIEEMPEAPAEAETRAAAVKEEAAADLVFVTERLFDGRAAIERGYMRLGGLLRELALRQKQTVENGEMRVYETFGGAPITVRLDMQRIMTDADRRLKAWHKPERLLYRGALTVSRGEAIRQTGFVGSCG